MALKRKEGSHSMKQARVALLWKVLVADALSLFSWEIQIKLCPNPVSKRIALF